MCVIAWALQASPRWPLVLAANRDEFHARPTEPLGFWPQAPHVCAGRDRRAGGTWMGLARDGRFAALTNVRDARRAVPADAVSRGSLVAGFLVPRPASRPGARAATLDATGSFIAELLSPETPDDYARRVAADSSRYAGFNLLLGDLTMRAPWVWIGTGSDGPQRLAPGVHAISNGSLHDDWFKTRLLGGALRRAVHDEADDEALFGALASTEVAPDAALPDTGVGVEQERLLAPIRVQAPGYGTRSSTVLRVAADGRVRIVERSFAPDGFDRWTERRIVFDLP